MQDGAGDHARSGSFVFDGCRILKKTNGADIRNSISGSRPSGRSSRRFEKPDLLLWKWDLKGPLKLEIATVGTHCAVPATSMEKREQSIGERE